MRDDIDDIFADITEPFIRHDDHLAAGACLFDGDRPSGRAPSPADDRLTGLLGILMGVGDMTLIQKFYRGATRALIDGAAPPAPSLFR